MDKSRLFRGVVDAIKSGIVEVNAPKPKEKQQNSLINRVALLAEMIIHPETQSVSIRFYNL